MQFSLILRLITIKAVACNFTPNYTEALELSMLFFDAQKSGKLPQNYKIKWRGDSALNDRGNGNEDLTGGYYDANDFVKFGYTTAFTTTILSWGGVLYDEAYEKSGLKSHFLDIIKWSTDYFVKCHTKKNEFYGQVGDFSIDHDFWGRPEDMNMSRPAYMINETHPGSDLAAEASAALSSSSLLFKKIDFDYSKTLLKHSQELYSFAKNFKEFYHNVIPGARDFYKSKSYFDELSWAAIWLYLATNEDSYLDEALDHYQQFLGQNPAFNSFSYDHKLVGIQLLLYEATKSETHLSSVIKFCKNLAKKEQHTPKGLVFVDKFGTLGLAANIAFICLQIPKDVYLNFSKQQIDYILGSTGRSFLVGYGTNYPLQPYHSASSCPDTPEPCDWNNFNTTNPNPQILYGALVSGPDANDVYEDKRDEFLFNAVSLDYNAGFQSALAGILNKEDIYNG